MRFTRTTVSVFALLAAMLSAESVAFGLEGWTKKKKKKGGGKRGEKKN